MITSLLSSHGDTSLFHDKSNHQSVFLHILIVKLLSRSVQNYVKINSKRLSGQSMLIGFDLDLDLDLDLTL